MGAQYNIYAFVFATKWTFYQMSGVYPPKSFFPWLGHSIMFDKLLGLDKIQFIRINLYDNQCTSFQPSWEAIWETFNNPIKLIFDKFCFWLLGLMIGKIMLHCQII